MSIPCLAVLTARSPGRLIAEGGTQAWRLKPESVAPLEYCVCIQNRHNGHWGGADQEHHHAFMIGRIRDVAPSPERPGRYIVLFSEYALIDIPDAWPGLRNPVRYASLEDFGILDPNSLTWNQMPKHDMAAAFGNAGEAGDDDPSGLSPLTIAEAKAALALGLGVPESAISIEISIRL